MTADIDRYYDGTVARIEIQHHERRNALDPALCEALRGHAESAAENARCIVITGQGTSFCAGADLGAVYDEEFRASLYAMLHSLREVRVPVIAAVNGPAIGAGTQLAIACDIRVVDVSARFAVPTARNGMAVDAWTVRRLRSLAGAGVASRMLLMAETFDASQAMHNGLGDMTGTVDDAMNRAREVADFAPLALAYNKMVLNETVDDAGIDAQFARVWGSADIREAAAARRDDRRPQFSGQ